MAAGLLAFFIALFASLMLVVPRARPCAAVGMVDLPGAAQSSPHANPLLAAWRCNAAVVIACSSPSTDLLRPDCGHPHRRDASSRVLAFSTTKGCSIIRSKLFVGMPLATGDTLSAEFTRRFFSVLGGGAPRQDFLGRPFLTVVWVVGITASFSILDHIGRLGAGRSRPSGFRFLGHGWLT